MRVSKNRKRVAKEERFFEDAFGTRKVLNREEETIGGGAKTKRGDHRESEKKISKREQLG